MKHETIQEFILGGERSFQIGAAVYEAWPEARAQLVDGFLRRLGSLLIKDLNGWRTEPRSEYFTTQWGSYAICKPAWGGRYSINLECWKYGEKMACGVWRNFDLLGKGSDQELLSAVKERYPAAKPYPYWEAQIFMHYPAPDWRKADVLWRMHTDETFLKDVAEQLRDVAEISAPFVDKLVSKHVK